MNEIIKFDDSCAVGVTELDDAHKVLFGIGNRMIAAVAQSKGQDVLSETIEEMIDYADRHFKREESLMEEAGFPQLDSHRAIHKRLLNDILLFKSEYLAHDIDDARVASFLIDWIVNHIKTVDKRYSTYMHAPQAP